MCVCVCVCVCVKLREIVCVCVYEMLMNVNYKRSDLGYSIKIHDQFFLIGLYRIYNISESAAKEFFSNYFWNWGS